MQIQFDPKDLDMGEATIVLGMVLPAFVKGCKAQGDTLAEIQAGIAELLEGTWAGVSRAEEGKS
jgi:hypothetical protein